MVGERTLADPGLKKMKNLVEALAWRSRPPLARMLQIHGRLSEGKRLNSRQLARELEVSYKTVQRDIDFMRERLELPIDYDARAHGFFYSRPVTQFPSVTISEGELVALFVARKALEQYRGTAFEKPLHMAFAKLTAALPDQIAFGWEDLDEAVSFRGGTTGRGIADLQVFKAVSQTVLRSRELEFGYRKLADGDPAERRRVQPLHLGCFENQWYLIAQDLARGAIRTFVLSRMIEVKETGRRFVRPAGFSPDQFLADSFGITAGLKPQRVRLRFNAFAARLIRERLWHSSQKLRELADGEIELELRVGVAPELERWLLGWGDRVQIIEPVQLRAAIHESARRVLLAAVTDDGANAREQE
jgi:predicted DNA-binding transcriptional regulator YafY